MPRLRSALESIGLRRRREEDDGTPPREEQAPEPAPELEPEPVPAPELAVSGRSARAILASGRPPVLEAPAQPQPQPEPRPAPAPEHAPPAPPPSAHEPREWNIWELERLVRAEGHDLRQEEWTALVLSLRDFAQADGTLPPEFDELVRESFGPLLASSEAATEPAAMS